MQSPVTHRRAMRVAAFGAGIAFLVVVGPLVFFRLVEGSSPPRLSLPAPHGQLAPGPVSGAWKVGTGSIAGYRVEEILFGQSHAAVGRTDQVTGQILISGTEVTSGDFTVNLASITSDQRSRDVQFHGYIMQTYRYKYATFRITKPIEFGSVSPGALPPAGRTIQAGATGDLTLRGVTRSVSFQVSADRAAGGIDVAAQIPITFSTWHIPNPSFVIAKVGDGGTIEVLLHLVPG